MTAPFVAIAFIVEIRKNSEVFYQKSRPTGNNAGILCKGGDAVRAFCVVTSAAAGRARVQMSNLKF
jgi:hypothetical protein